MNTVTQSAFLNSPSFYTTPIHECGYLPGNQAITLFVDPAMPKNTSIYSELSQYGFRRSGENLYRPNCLRCHACIPVRVPVDEFQPNRGQRRTWRRNQDLEVVSVTPRFRTEHYVLYKRYLATRHKGGGMDNPSQKSFMDFLTSNWAKSIFYELRLQQRLLAVAVVDRLNDGFSAVYTFFDPRFSCRSLGKFAILLEIDEARRRGLKWVYLGYWIRQCSKMDYKNQFQPLEYYWRGRWERRSPHELSTPT